LAQAAPEGEAVAEIRLSYCWRLRVLLEGEAWSRHFRDFRRSAFRQTVVKMLYRPDGTQIGRELVTDPDLEAYLSYRDEAWRGAVPFQDYWARLASGV
jgi:hypothetical protein